MSGIYQKQVNSGAVASPSAGRTLISVNESGELFTKDSSGAVSITQPKFTPVPEFHLLDIGSLFDAIMADLKYFNDWCQLYSIVSKVTIHCYSCCSGIPV